MAAGAALADARGASRLAEQCMDKAILAARVQWTKAVSADVEALRV